jgi:hypothetical protein
MVDITSGKDKIYVTYPIELDINSLDKLSGFDY